MVRTLYQIPRLLLHILLTNWPTRHQGYLTSVLLAWMNARCVSFSLDRIWGEITKSHNSSTNILYLYFVFDEEMEIFPPRFGTIRAYWVGLPAPRLLLLLLTPRHHGASCVKSNLQRELFKNTPTNKQVNWGKSCSLRKTLTGPCCNGYFGKHWDIFFGLLSLIWCFSFSSSRFWFTCFLVNNRVSHYIILHCNGCKRSFLQL